MYLFKKKSLHFDSFHSDAQHYEMYDRHWEMAWNKQGVNKNWYILIEQNAELASMFFCGMLTLVLFLKSYILSECGAITRWKLERKNWSINSGISKRYCNICSKFFLSIVSRYSRGFSYTPYEVFMSPLTLKDFYHNQFHGYSINQ